MRVLGWAFVVALIVFCGGVAVLVAFTRGARNWYEGE